MARARDRGWDRDHPRCAGFTACAIAPGRSARAGRPGAALTDQEITLLTDGVGEQEPEA